MIEIVLAGNPNVGKSTIFNCLTGMKQHTGNWAGKTVANAEGIWKTEDTAWDKSLHERYRNIAARSCKHKTDRRSGMLFSCRFIYGRRSRQRSDLRSAGRRRHRSVRRHFCLERNLILVLQILKHRNDVVICVNLMDQVRKRGLVNRYEETLSNTRSTGGEYRIFREEIDKEKSE